MARTTKDRPERIDRNNPRLWVGEQHWACFHYGEPCTINDVVGPNESYGCYHEMPAHHPWTHRYTEGSTSKERRDRYWAPERARTRDGLTDLRKAHRAGNRTDESTSLTDQHRHGAAWWD